MGIRLVTRKFSEKQVKTSVFRILRTNVLCSMATVTQGSEAHINTAYFAYSGQPEIFFVSYPDSLHYKNMSKNHSMAMTIFSSAQTWGKPDRGMQLFGICKEAKGRWKKKAEQVYGRRFRGFARWKKRIEKDEGEFPLRFYRFVPAKAQVLDENEFGGGTFVVVPFRK